MEPLAKLTSSRSAGDYHSVFPPEPILWGVKGPLKTAPML